MTETLIRPEQKAVEASAAPAAPKPKGPGPRTIEKSKVMARIDAGEEVSRSEVGVELDRLNDRVKRFRKKELRLSDGQRLQLLDDQRRLQAHSDLVAVAVREERAAKRDQRFQEALGIGLAGIDNPGLLLSAVVYALKRKVKLGVLMKDPILSIVVEAAEMCLLKQAKQAKTNQAKQR